MFLHNDIFKLFDSMVTPILCYASEIWGYEYSGTVEKVQADFCKYFLGVNSSVNNSVALGECGRLYVLHIIVIVLNIGANYYICIMIVIPKIATKCLSH